MRDEAFLQLTEPEVTAPRRGGLVLPEYLATLEGDE
jgi:hypothetical protein